MEDLLEQTNEIQETLGRSYNVPDELDEADLEAGKPRNFFHCILLVNLGTTELEALQLEEEEEGPSYLADMNKAPDFVDEEPVEFSEVRLSHAGNAFDSSPCFADSACRGTEDSGWLMNDSIHSVFQFFALGTVYTVVEWQCI